MLLAFTFYNIQPFLFPCIRVDQQGWLPQHKGIGHSLVLRTAAGKFRVIYGQQHIGLLDDPPIGHKLCVRCLLIVDFAVRCGKRRLDYGINGILLVPLDAIGRENLLVFTVGRGILPGRETLAIGE